MFGDCCLLFLALFVVCLFVFLLLLCVSRCLYFGLVDDCCLLCGVSCGSVVVRCGFFVACCVLVVLCRLLCDCSLLGVWRWACCGLYLASRRVGGLCFLFVVCCVLLVVCCVLCVVCCLWFVVRRSPCVDCAWRFVMVVRSCYGFVVGG